MAELKWVFGLAIDDDLTWGVAPVNPSEAAEGHEAYPHLDFPHAHITKLPNAPNLPNSTLAELKKLPHDDLRELITSYLRQLRHHKEVSPILDKVESIGVSTIGITNRRRGRLVEIRRKLWRREDEDNFVLDIRDMLQKEFPQIVPNASGRLPIAIHNDATAKCMVHRSFLGMKPDDVLCYLNFSQGINIGAADRSGPLLSSDLHPEVGHQRPRLSFWDRNRLSKSENSFRKHLGCRVHNDCFEAVASGFRIEDQWGHLDNLPEDHEAYNSIPDYLAQICWNAGTFFAPSRIVINGTAVPTKPDKVEYFLKRIREEFLKLNRGTDEDGRTYLKYDALDSTEVEFIQTATPIPLQRKRRATGDVSAIMGAIELGRLAARGTRIGDMVRAHDG